MRIVEVYILNDSDLIQLYRLWNDEYPVGIGYRNLENFKMYLNNLQDLSHFLLVDDSKQIMGWAFSFKRENADWFALLISDSFQKRGYGKIFLDKIKSRCTELYGWVIDHNNDLKENGEPYMSPLQFYIKNDFIVLPDERLELDNISAVKIRWNSCRLYK